MLVFNRGQTRARLEDGMDIVMEREARPTPEKSHECSDQNTSEIASDEQGKSSYSEIAIEVEIVLYCFRSALHTCFQLLSPTLKLQNMALLLGNCLNRMNRLKTSCTKNKHSKSC